MTIMMKKYEEHEQLKHVWLNLLLDLRKVVDEGGWGAQVQHLYFRSQACVELLFLKRFSFHKLSFLIPLSLSFETRALRLFFLAFFPMFSLFGSSIGYV